MSKPSKKCQKTCGWKLHEFEDGECYIIAPKGFEYGDCELEEIKFWDKDFFKYCPNCKEKAEEK